jgi:riboflavin kinase/FMN adenylyltransferase
VRATFDARELRPAPRGAVVSLGVFDGVHLGHQAILARNVEVAQSEGMEATVFTFRRHPKKVLLGHAPQQITTLDYRLELFRRLRIEHVVALEFTDELRQLSAEQFAVTTLVQGLGARAFVLGFDSKFGRDRAGTPELLRSLGQRVEVVPQVIVRQRPVSSTAIREAVQLGDLAGAAAMLGRPVSILGRVIHGDARGRELGFPTANLDLMQGLHPPFGVYAGWARILRHDESAPRGSPHRAVINIGLRPSFHRDPEAPPEPRVEVHLLDFSGDLYGQRLEFEFVAALRPERRFESLGALRDQIAADVVAARERLLP